MNPTIEVINGKTAKIQSSYREPTGKEIVDSFEVTPQILDDGNIDVATKMVFQNKQMGDPRTHINIKDSGSLVIGSVTKTEKRDVVRDGVKGSEERTTEVLVILTLTIITPEMNLSKKTAMQVKMQEKKDQKELSKFKTTLANGVTVELVGICEYPSAGKQWWRPDGTPFTLPTGIKVEDRISRARVGDNACQFLFRYNSQENLTWHSIDALCLHFSIEGDSGTNLINLRRLPEGGQDGLIAKVAIFKDPLGSTTIQANLATGNWQTKAVRDISKIDQRNEDLYWFTSETPSTGNVSLHILHRIEGQQIKTIAIDKEGNEYRASYSLGSFNGTASISQIDGRRYVAPLAKDDRLVKFKLQSRPFWSSVIGNVSLRPNSTTLPNGVTVEQPVTKRVPEDYPTVFAAVNAAKAGDTLVISADRYRSEDTLIEPKLEIEVEKPAVQVKGEQRNIIRGIVRDETGKPVIGALVLPLPHGGHPVTTGANGKFELLGPSENRRIEMLLVRDINDNLAAAVEFSDRNEPADITLTKGIAITGRITDPNGMPIAGAKIHPSVHSEEWRAGFGYTVFQPTDSNGIYEIKALPVGQDYSVGTGGVEGYGGNSIRLDLLEKPGWHELKDIVLEPANLSVSGVVLDGKDKPVADAIVQTSGKIQPTRKISTDSTGKFKINGLCKGRVNLDAWTSDDQWYGSDEVKGGDKNIEIFMSKGLGGICLIPPKNPPTSLIGKMLPDLKELGIGLLEKDIRGNLILVCFWKLMHDESRDCIRQLTARSDELARKNVVIVAVQIWPRNEKQFRRWLEKNNVQFPVSILPDPRKQKPEERIFYRWGLQSGVPWSILTDSQHVVRAEGFSIDELDEKIHLSENSDVQVEAGKEALTAEPLVLKLVDNSGRPVAGAKVGTSVRTRDEQVLNSKLYWSLSSKEKDFSDEDGKIVLTQETLFPESWNPDRRRALYILNEERQIGAFCEISKDDARNQIELTLEPVCHVHGKLSSEDLEEIGRPLTWSNVYLSFNKDSHGVLSCMSEKQQFDFWVPPGEYTLSAYGSGDGASTKHVRPIIEVKTGQSELDLGVVDLPATKLSKLMGKSAPEIGPIRAWKNGSPVKLSELRGKPVILHFGGGYPSTSRDLPKLVELHEDFHDAGLVIIAIYNCESMEQLEQRFRNNSEKFGGAPDVPFRLAVDGGQGRPIEGTDRTIPGATYATYEISSYNTTVLINSKGEIVERLGLYGAKEKLENMLGVEVKTTVSTWRQRFEEVYRLEDNRILKRIAPPFIPERLEYYNHEESHQAEAIPEPPDYFTFHWENNKLKKWGLGFTGGKRPLDSILRQNLSIEANKFDGPEELLQIEVPGDWIVRKPSTVEKRLRALEKILSEEIRRDILFEKREVELEVVVATGRFKFHPPSETYEHDSVHLYADELDPDEGAGGGTADSVNDFFLRLGSLVDMPVADHTESSKKIKVPYRHHRTSYLRRIKDKAEKASKLEMLLANLTKQTELQFRIEKRPVEVWFITEQKKDK